MDLSFLRWERSSRSPGAESGESRGFGGVLSRNSLNGAMPGAKSAIDLDAADRRILRVLQRDGRIAVTALAEEVGRASAGALGGLLYLGLVPTALAFSTWGYALARMDAGRLGVTTYLVPPLAVVLAWVLLEEVPAPLALAGGVVCLAGVALSRRR